MCVGNGIYNYMETTFQSACIGCGSLSYLKLYDDLLYLKIVIMYDTFQKELNIVSL